MLTSIDVYINEVQDDGSNRFAPYLEVGEPYLTERPTMRLLDEQNAFIRQHFVRSAKRKSPNTWKAAAYALKSWLEFLTALDVEWDLATRIHLEKFRKAHEAILSPQTGRKYAKSTIAARMNAVIGFYRFAAKRGSYEGSLYEDVIVPARRGFMDLDPLAHLRKGTRQAVKSTLSDLVPRVGRGRAKAHPITVPDWQKIRTVLGPMPSEQGTDRLRSCRARLMHELALWTGLRLSEVNGLTKYQFLAMLPDPDAPLAYQRLDLDPKTTKREKEDNSTIRIPNWLVVEINLYIEGERSDSVEAGKHVANERTKRGKPTKYREPAKLFVALGDSKRWAGKSIGVRRMEQLVTEACLEAGVVRIENRTDPETGETVGKVSAKHSFHDFRHTYAVWTYYAEKKSGNSEPWKVIQAQLRHESLQTTIDTYLRHVELFTGQEALVDVRAIVGL